MAHHQLPQTRLRCATFPSFSDMSLLEPSLQRVPCAPSISCRQPWRGRASIESRRGRDGGIDWGLDSVSLVGQTCHFVSLLHGVCKASRLGCDLRALSGESSPGAAIKARQRRPEDEAQYGEWGRGVDTARLLAGRICRMVVVTQGVVVGWANEWLGVVYSESEFQTPRITVPAGSSFLACHVS